MKKEEIKTLYRSEENKVIAGVCGGIGEYFNVDPVIIRLVAFILIFFGGTGLILYILAWIIIPKNPNQKAKKTSAEKIVHKVVKKDKTAPQMILGIIIILIGVGLLLKNIFNWFDLRFFWPSIIIILGIFLIMKGDKHE